MGHAAITYFGMKYCNASTFSLFLRRSLIKSVVSLKQGRVHFHSSLQIVSDFISLLFNLYHCYHALGSPIVAQLACCCVSIYPIFGSYYVLMSNADYRAKVSSIVKRVYGRTARVESISVLSKSN
ncbi:unnamed protein product [Auanema sp. JU1783]|nr:unnamed protein product [Auanema sp. JU1783]